MAVSNSAEIVERFVHPGGKEGCAGWVRAIDPGVWGCVVLLQAQHIVDPEFSRKKVIEVVKHIKGVCFGATPGREFVLMLESPCEHQRGAVPA
jgi:hypothetical protein